MIEVSIVVLSTSTRDGAPYQCWVKVLSTDESKPNEVTLVIPGEYLEFIDRLKTLDEEARTIGVPSNFFESELQGEAIQALAQSLGFTII